MYDFRHSPEFPELLKRTNESLKGLGFYDIPFTTPENYYSKCMEIAIDKLKGEDRDGAFITVEAIPPHTGNNPLHIEFIYHYQPGVYQQMYLEVIRVTMGDHFQAFYLPDFYVSPSAQEIYSYVAESIKTEKAKQILNQMKDKYKIIPTMSKKI